MLTGDKLETAICIAKSSKLVSRTQDIHTFGVVSGRTDAHLELNALRRKQDNALIITGNSLEVCFHNNTTSNRKVSVKYFVKKIQKCFQIRNGACKKYVKNKRKMLNDTYVSNIQIEMNL